MNNVGTSYDHPEFFSAVEKEQLRNVTVVNTVSVVMVSLYSVIFLYYYKPYNLVQMTRLVLTKMIERNSGVIVNVGSASGTMVQPLLSAYSASKVNFISTFLFSRFIYRFGILQFTSQPG